MITLTNKLTKVYFSQYGEQKVLEYNGTASEARNYCKGAYGVKTVCTYYTTTREAFLPKGYSSIETISN